MIVGSLLCIKSKISLVPYLPPQSNSLIIDNNGYIGYKQTAKDSTYYATLDSSADFSQSELGQVTIIEKLNPIGNLVINGHEYGIIKLDNWLIIDRNLTEPIGNLNTDYVVPPSDHSEAGYFYKGSSLYDASTSDWTTLAKNFLSSVGEGWEFTTKEFFDFFVSKYSGFDSIFFRKETWNNGLNIFGLNFVGARYANNASSFDYTASILPARVGNYTYWICINESGNVSFPVESGVLHYYNPHRLIKKLS